MTGGGEVRDESRTKAAAANAAAAAAAAAEAAAAAAGSLTASKLARPGRLADAPLLPPTSFAPERPGGLCKLERVGTDAGRSLGFDNAERLI